MQRLIDGLFKNRLKTKCRRQYFWPLSWGWIHLQ